MRLWTALLAVSSAALASEPTNLTEWEEAYQFECNAPFTHFAPAVATDFEGVRYEHSGATLKVRRLTPRAGKVATLGLLAGIKDAEPETLEVLSQFIATFEKADVDAIVIGGDSSVEPDVLDAIYAYLAKTTKRPLLSIAGNMERGGAHNYAINKARKAGATNLINMGLVRRFDGEGVDVVSLSGYHDKAFLHLSGGCLYTDKHLADAVTAAKASDDTVVWLSHGPPRMKGEKAIDFVPGSGNVGNPAITDALSQGKVKFGIAGHILEAAGKATDLTGKPQPQKKWLPSLFVNQGSANPLPWKLNDGSTSWGLAALLSIEGAKGSYEVLKAPKPTPKAAQ